MQKVELSLLDIGWSIIQAVEKIPEKCDYQRMGVFLALLLGSLPLLFRGYLHQELLWQIPEVMVVDSSPFSMLRKLSDILGRAFLGRLVV